MQALSGTGRLDELESLVKSLRDSPYEYTYYIKGYLLPMIDKKRKNGQLSNVQGKTMVATGLKGTYEGEVDEHNKACGVGVFRAQYDTIKGTFCNDLPEGLNYIEQVEIELTGEMKAGRLFGKCTMTRQPYEMWINKIYGEDQRQLSSDQDYVECEHAYYQRVKPGLTNYFKIDQ